MKATDAQRQALAEVAGEAFPRMTNFSFDYGNAHWTIVDSNPYVDWTDPKLKEWVAADLLAAKDATWRFVAFHHPGFNSSNEHLEQQHMRLLARRSSRPARSTSSSTATSTTTSGRSRSSSSPSSKAR